MLPATLQFLIVMIASSINERIQKRLDYKSEEVLVLKEILIVVTGKRRIDFNESQRKRLAIKGKELTPKEREEWCELVRPRTILEWFRRIYAEKYDSSKSRRRPGRPRKPEETRTAEDIAAIVRDKSRYVLDKNLRHVVKPEPLSLRSSTPRPAREGP